MHATSRRTTHSSQVLFSILACILVACGPSQETLDATATQDAANRASTQTAQAPTPTNTKTVTLTPTLTPTGTPTLTPTHTPTFTPSPTETPKPTSTPAPPVPMYQFGSFAYRTDFEIEIPDDWERGISMPGEGQISVLAMAPDQSAAVEIYVADLLKTGFGSTTLVDYVISDVALQSQLDPSFDLLSREPDTTVDGQPVEILVYTQQNGDVISHKLSYLYEDDIAIVVTYLTLMNNYEDLLPIIEYSFGTFAVGQ